MMSVTQTKAQLIAQGAITSSGNAITDPTAVITAVAAIIGQVMSLLKSCQKTPTAAAQSIQQAASGSIWGWFGRRQLWRAVQAQQLPSGVSHIHVYDSLLRYGMNLSVPEVAAMYRGD